MNTVMKNCGTCRYCGKTVRFMQIKEPVDSHVITVEAESTAPEDMYFDPKRPVPHRARCKHTIKPVEVTYADGKPKKKPCGCKGKKKTNNPYPNLLQHETTKTVSVDEKP